MRFSRTEVVSAAAGPPAPPPTPGPAQPAGAPAGGGESPPSMLVELARAIVALGRGRVRLCPPWKGRVEVTRSEWQRLEALAAAGLQEAKANP